MKKKPTGFIAICQCGKIVGAMDFNRVDQIKAGKILGEWLASGCIVKPRFEDSWQETVSSCECEI